MKVLRLEEEAGLPLHIFNMRDTEVNETKEDYIKELKLKDTYYKDYYEEGSWTIIEGLNTFALSDDVRVSIWFGKDKQEIIQKIKRFFDNREHILF